MCYFIGWQCRRLKSANSIRSWEAAVTWLGQCLAQINNESWKKNIEYISTRTSLIAQFGKPTKELLPFTLQHIITYTKNRNVTPDKYWTCAYDDLLDITWLQLLFITMSRPCEILNKPGDNTKNGLTFNDWKYRNPPGAHYFQLSVLHYKNQKSRLTPKELTLSSTSCGSDSCNCRYINPYYLFYVLISRRRKLSKLPSLNQKQLTNLQTKRHNHLFVRRCGTIMTTTNTKPIIKHMISTIQVLEPHKYSEYSIRVGGATHCTAAGIPDALMYRYVGWDPRQLPDSAKKYIRPPLELRLKTPFFMLHGFTDSFGKHHKVLPACGLFHNPWELNSPSAWPL